MAARLGGMEQIEAIRRSWRDWVNPAVTRGLVLIGASLLLLINPDISTSLVQYVIGGALVLIGLANLWSTVRHWRQPRWWLELLESGAAVGLGLLIMLHPRGTLDTIAVILGLYLAARGIGALYRAIRGGPSHRMVEIVRGGAMLSVATIAIFLPESLLASAVVVASAAALAVGALFVTYGLQSAIKGESAEADADTVTGIVGSLVQPTEPVVQFEQPYLADPNESVPETLPDFPVPTPANLPEAVPGGHTPDPSPANRLVIPKIGLDTVIKYVPFSDYTWLIAGLRQEIAWMGETSLPGAGRQHRAGGPPQPAGRDRGSILQPVEAETRRPGDRLHRREQADLPGARERAGVGGRHLHHPPGR